jgi:hypothetical protein
MKMRAKRTNHPNVSHKTQTTTRVCSVKNLFIPSLFVLIQRTIINKKKSVVHDFLGEIASGSHCIAAAAAASII